MLETLRRFGLKKLANSVLACHFDEITSRNWLNYTSTIALVHCCYA